MPRVDNVVELTGAPKTRTRARVYLCILCSKKFFTDNGWCPSCGGDKSLVLLPPELAELDAGALVRANAYTPGVRNFYEAGEWAGAYPKGVPGGTVLVLRGDPGAGKTRLALRLGTRQRLCGMLELEMSREECFDLALSAGADMDRLIVGDTFRGPDTFSRFAAEGCDCLIIDSVQKLAYKPAPFFNDIRRWAKGGDGGRLVIAITQSNAKGGTRGGLSIDFDLAETSAHVRVTEHDTVAEVDVWKNRQGHCCKFRAAKGPDGEPLLKRPRRVK